MKIFRFFVLLLVVTWAKPTIAQNTDPNSALLTPYLARLDSLFAGVPAWIWNLYEPTSGGFYENLAMRQQPNRFGPDIQSTIQALSMLAACGQPISQLPDSVRRQVIHFFQSRQEAKTGFFVDPDYPQARQSERVLGRLVRFSTEQLSKLGSAPLYPLPGQQANPEATLNYFASAEALNKWLDKLNWEKSVWSAMDAISSQSSLLNSLPEKTQKAYTQQIYDYALARQNADGLWGEGQPILVRLSGTVKFAWFCRDTGFRVPQPEKIYQTLLAWYQTHPSQQDDFKQDTCFPGNTIALLGELMSYLPQPFPHQDIALVLAESTAMTKAFQTPDGGFCRHVGRYYARPDDLFPPLAEFSEPVGDMNGASQLCRVRRWAFTLAGRPLVSN